MVLPNPASPATTMPETSARRTMTGRAVLGPAQPPGRQGRRGHAGQVDPGRGQQRIAVQAAQPDQARALLLGPDAHAAPGVGQVPGGLLVVGQAGPGDGRDRGGDALVVSDELGRPGSGAGGSTDPGSRGRGSGRAVATRPPTGGPAGSAPGRRPAGDAGGPDEPAAAGLSRQPARVAVPPTRASSMRQADEGGQHQRTPPRVHRGRRRRLMSSPSQQRSTSSPSPSSAWSGQRQRACQPDAQAGQSGLSAHISRHPLRHHSGSGGGTGASARSAASTRAAASSRRAAGGPWMWAWL